MENSKAIELVKKPEIAHRLQELGANVTKRLEDLNLDKLVANEDTIKALKTLRADLNKELDTYEEQRKFVKNGVLNPYNEFETIYKTEISDKYAKAINTLKDKIALVENKVKTEKQDRVKAYFDELCQSEKIDFLKFESVGLEINLSTTEKAYKEKCNDFIKKVNDDLALIKTTDYEAEILVEYKQSLNVSSAISSVKTRKENEKIEAERLRQAELVKREREVISSEMVFDDFSKTYIYDDEIFITVAFLKESTKEEFTKKLIECQEKIKERKASEKPEVKQSEMSFFAPSGPAISAPTVKESTPAEELVTASFKVTGTMAQLKALGQYLRDNKINYQNI